MLAEDAEDEGHDEMIPDLEKINSAGKHLLALINDILDLSKIEAGRMDLYLERFELRRTLDEAVATITPLIRKNDNQLVTEFADDLGTVRADLTKLRQALFNLLSKATKFTEKGAITLAAVREQREGCLGSKIECCKFLRGGATPFHRLLSAMTSSRRFSTRLRTLANRPVSSV